LTDNNPQVVATTASINIREMVQLVYANHGTATWKKCHQRDEFEPQLVCLHSMLQYWQVLINEDLDNKYIFMG
jgi:hypothetical protein